MATGINEANIAANMKRRYSPLRIKHMLFSDNPVLAMIKRNEEMDGEDGFRVPCVHGMPQSTSPTFSVAKSQSTTSTGAVKMVQFSVPRVTNYGIISLDRQFLKATKGDNAAFWSALTKKTDLVLTQLKRDLSINFFRAGWGKVGVIGSVSSATITLSQKADVQNFEVGAQYEFAAAESSGTLRNTGGTTHLTVVGVDRNAGTVTMNANISTITGTVANDTIFRRGSREDAASPTRLNMSGLLDWVPESAPGATLFNGVDRTADTRLGGSRYDGSQDGIYDALVNGAEVVQTNGGSPDTCVLHPTKMTELTTSGASFEPFHEITDEKARIGVSGFKLYTPAGLIKVIQSRDCPVNNAFLLTLDHWRLGSLGPCPHIFDDDGVMLREADDDGYQIRAGYYGNIYCDAPGWQCNIKLA